MSTLRFLAREAVLLVLLLVMLVGAILFNQPEFLFPELAALGLGSLVLLKRVWKVSKWRLVVLLSFASLLGTVLQLYSPCPFVVNMGIGFIGVGAMLILLRSSLYPALSACLLPLVLDEGSWVYPGAVVVLSLLLVGAQGLSEWLHWRAKLPFRPVETPVWRRFQRLGLLAVVVVVWSIGAYYSGHLYFVFPPLIVLFVEMARPGTGLRKAPLRILLLIAVSALLGNLSIFVFVYTPLLNLVLSPIWALVRVLSVMIAIILLLGVFSLSKRYFAPAMAIALLPQLAYPDTWWQFPLEVTLSAALLIGVAYLLPSPKQPASLVSVQRSASAPTSLVNNPPR